MTSPPGAATADAHDVAPAASTASGRALSLGAEPEITYAEQAAQRALESAARESAAFAQLQRCTPRWVKVLDELAPAALRRLAENEPVDPNDPETWRSRTAHGHAIFRRHGYTHNLAWRLTDGGLTALIDAQRAADAAAGLEWSQITTPASRLDEALARAHAGDPLDLTDPRIWSAAGDKRTALGRRLGLSQDESDDLSSYALLVAEEFHREDLRNWRLASPSWGRLATEQLGEVDFVDAPVGVYLMRAREPAKWCLIPTFSAEMLQLILQLGGTVTDDLTRAELAPTDGAAIAAAVSAQALEAPEDASAIGRSLTAGARSARLTELLGAEVTAGELRIGRDKWARVVVDRRTDFTLELIVQTVQTRGFGTRALGRRGTGRDGHVASAPTTLADAVAAAAQRQLPVLLSSEAAGELAGNVQVARMAGRPGLLTLTRASGLSAVTETMPIDRAIGELRRMKTAQEPVVLDAGAREQVRMALAPPLDDDPVLLGKQRQATSLMVTGSGVNGSSTGTGKSVMTGRAVFHRASRTVGLRAVLVAEGRLLPQWRRELLVGDPARKLPPLCPNANVVILDERAAVSAQLRRLDRDVGDGRLVVLVPRMVLERFRTELEVLKYHLLVVDEGHRYQNPLTDAHRALRAFRFSSVADCWLLTATPKGKSAETVDILVGLAVKDAVMIDERPNVREGGNLLREGNAHRVRMHYGHSFVRVTRADMAEWMPDVRPAKAIALEPDEALATLLEEIRSGGRDAYRHLLALLEELKRIEPGSRKYKEALKELSRAQGVVLGNVGVFYDASVDPETLIHSKAALAIALHRRGLVEPAMLGGGDGLPLLRGFVAETLAASASELQSLVCAERVCCLRQLAGTLRERHGVDARVGDGSVGREEFEALKRAYVAGDFPILLLSSVGQEGHNLQNASQLAHLDLPYVSSRFGQRVGRFDRMGSPHDELNMLIPYIRGGAMEHVVGILAPRGAEEHQLLDSFDGMLAREAPVATGLAEITSQVAARKSQDGYEATAAQLRVAAAVFGAS